MRVFFSQFLFDILQSVNQGVFTSRTHFSIKDRWSVLEGDFASIEKAGGESAMNTP